MIRFSSLSHLFFIIFLIRFSSVSGSEFDADQYCLKYFMGQKNMAGAASESKSIYDIVKFRNF